MSRDKSKPFWRQEGCFGAAQKERKPITIARYGRERQLTRSRTAKAAGAMKRQFLVQLDPDLIRRIKILAIDRNVSASSLVQQALVVFLASEAGKSPPTGPTETAP